MLPLTYLENIVVTMTEHDEIAALLHVLTTQTNLAQTWVGTLTKRCWHLQHPSAPVQELVGRCGVFLEALAEALHACERIELGSVQLREPLKHFSFTAGWLLGADLPVGTAVELCHTLEETLGAGPKKLYRALVVVSTEAYVCGERQRAIMRHRQIIKKSQIVIPLSATTTALILVGDPDNEALEDAVSRLMMLTVMRCPDRLVVDLANIQDQTPVVVSLLKMLACHKQGLTDRKVLLSGLTNPTKQTAKTATTLPITFVENIEDVTRDGLTEDTAPL